MPGMEPTGLFRNWWSRALLVVGIFTILGFVDAGQGYFYHNLHGNPIPFGTALATGVSDWYVWAALTPFLVWMVRRWPLDEPSLGRFAIHGVASLSTSLIVIAVAIPIIRNIPGALVKPIPTWQLFQWLLAHKLIFYLLTHWLILGVTHGILYYNTFQANRLRTSQLETQLTRTQLQMLKMQLQPHFLFNTLHAISALMHRDVELADRMLARLAQLLRTTLDASDTQEVTVEQELEFIQPYLEIEQARLGSRLSVSLDVDPEVLDALIPNLLLQPLVENAVRHGIAPRCQPGRIEIALCREGDRLRVRVRDTGPGLPNGQPLREGVGLSNTRARLARLYGADHEFLMANDPAGGLAVTVRLPYRELLPNQQPEADTGSRPEPTLAEG